jgi:hypothetical protein
MSDPGGRQSRTPRGDFIQKALKIIGIQHGRDGAGVAVGVAGSHRAANADPDIVESYVIRDVETGEPQHGIGPRRDDRERELSPGRVLRVIREPDQGTTD